MTATRKKRSRPNHAAIELQKQVDEWRKAADALRTENDALFVRLRNAEGECSLNEVELIHARKRHLERDEADKRTALDVRILTSERDLARAQLDGVVLEFERLVPAEDRSAWFNTLTTAGAAVAAVTLWNLLARARKASPGTSTTPAASPGAAPTLATAGAAP